jgi:hypothetical protein
MSAHQWLRDKADNRPARAVGWGVYGITTAFLLGVGIWTILRLHEQSSLTCPAKSNALPDFGMIAAGLAALLAGRFVGAVRFRDEWKRSPDGGASSTLGKIAFRAFMVVCFVALLYEALGTQQTALTSHDTIPGLAPITQYVRCSIYYAKLNGASVIIVYLVIIGVCGLVGNWLWSYHPLGDLGPQTAAATQPEAAHE